MFLEITSTNITNWVLQDLFSQNPCYSSNNMLELAKCLVKLDVAMCSITLHKTHERYGAIIFRVWLVSFFWRWETHLLLSRYEKRPGVKWLLEDHLQYMGKFCMWGVCRTMGLNWSGTAALWGCRDLSSLPMPFTEICIWGIWLYGPYMWSLPIWRKPPDMVPPFTPSRRGSKNPDIYEFRFFAFAKS